MQKHQRVKTPTTKRQQKRMPMKTVVKKIVDKWSTSYIEGAKAGDVPSLLKLAEMQHTGSGFGKIKYNPYQGRRWIEHASTLGKPDERITKQMRRLVVEEETRRDKMEHLQRFQFAKGEHFAFQFDPTEKMGVFTSRGGPMWYWLRHPDHHDKPGGRSRLEERGKREMEKTGGKFLTLEEDFAGDKIAYREYLQRFHKVRPIHETETLRAVRGVAPIPSATPPMSSRFEQNYAIKAVLDGKLQRRLTDPIPRPIHEYIMVAGTPMPQFVDPVTQTIQFADTMKGKLKTSLEAQITGKTYERRAATMADTPVVPTPVGNVRRYTDLVDDEKFNMANITMGKPYVMLDKAPIVEELANHAFWPLPDTSHSKLQRTIRRAYKHALDGEEFTKLRHLQWEDAQEYHGAHSTNLYNPHFDELNQRSDHEFGDLHPLQMWDGDEWTEDDDLKLDNFSGTNIGWELDREVATPTIANFPYNGIPRRSFFLTDPHSIVRPWVNQNEDGSDIGESPLPMTAHNQLYTDIVAEGYASNFTSKLTDQLPMPLDLAKEDGRFETAQNRFSDPIGAGERSVSVIGRPGGVKFFDPIEAQEKLVQLYNPRNYLTRQQYSNMYTDSITKFNPEDEIWYMDNDSLDVRKLPKTTDPAERKQQVEVLVDRWMNVHQMQRDLAKQQHTNQRFRDGGFTPRETLDSEDEKMTREARHHLTRGRDTHADFAFKSAKVEAQVHQSKINKIKQQLYKEGQELRPYDSSLVTYDNDGNRIISPEVFAMKDFNALDATYPDVQRLPGQQDVMSTTTLPITKRAKITREQAYKNATKKLVELQLADPVKNADLTLESLIQAEEFAPIESDDVEVPDFSIDPFNDNGWIKSMDVNLHLGDDDDHFGGYLPLGKDKNAYMPLDKFVQKGPIHPADGSPMLLDATTRLHANYKRFKDNFDEVFEDVVDPIDAQDEFEQFGNEMKGGDHVNDENSNDEQDLDSKEARNKRFAENDKISDASIREQLTEKITKMVDGLNDGSLYVPEYNSSEDEEVYAQTKPFMRPMVTTYTEHHPFWNRVIPNPHFFMPGPTTNHRVPRRQRNYEATMWNTYATDPSLSYADVQLTMAHNGKDEFFDPSRAQAIYSDDQNDPYDENKTYTRQEVDQALQTGLFTIARRSDVNAIRPVERNLGPLNKM